MLLDFILSRRFYFPTITVDCEDPQIYEHSYRNEHWLYLFAFRHDEIINFSVDEEAEGVIVHQSSLNTILFWWDGIFIALPRKKKS